MDGTPAENVRDAVRVTRQTGHIPVPSLSPDGSQLVYLSDNGGHANLWVARSDGTNPHQNHVRTRSSRRGRTAEVVSRRQPDRLRGQRRARAVVARPSRWPWCEDAGRSPFPRPGLLTDAGCTNPDVAAESYCIEKVPVDGGPAVVVRAIRIHTRRRLVVRLVSAHLLPESRCASGAGTGRSGARLLRTARRRCWGASLEAAVSCRPLYIHFALSPDERALAMGLADGVTTNIWTLGTSDGAWRRITRLRRGAPQSSRGRSHGRPTAATCTPRSRRTAAMSIVSTAWSGREGRLKAAPTFLSWPLCLGRPPRA